MKVTAVDKYTGEKIYELETKECEVEHIADVSRLVRLGECRAHMNDIPIQREYSDNNDTFFAAANAGITVTEQARAVQEGRLFGYHRFDVPCPDYTPERCYTFCPQFDDQEVR